MNILFNKNILLGITGSIAAYKAADLTSKLKKEGCNVKVVMTKSSGTFITETTLESLSLNPVYTDEDKSGHVGNFTHLDLAKWADIVLIAPCTANFMNKLANGHGDDLLSTICLAFTKNIFIAPAMNPDMWENKATKENLKKLNKSDVSVLGPGYGLHACGDTGYGRMIDSLSIIESIKNENKKNELSGLNILVTAGPTREPIDPVRFMSNYSSGKMGYAMAIAAKELGANVELISGPVQIKAIPEIKTTFVETSKEMMNAVLKKVKYQNIFISVAAIADYRPTNYSNKKHKKKEKSLNIEFQRGDDILKTVSEKYNNIFTVGFAAETDHIDNNALYKLKEKNLDIIVGNIANHEKKLGFESDYNEVVVFSKSKKIKIKKDRKLNIALEIVSFMVDEYLKNVTVIKKDVK